MSFFGSPDVLPEHGSLKLDSNVSAFAVFSIPVLASPCRFPSNVIISRSTSELSREYNQMHTSLKPPPTQKKIKNETRKKHLFSSN